MSETEDAEVLRLFEELADLDADQRLVYLEKNCREPALRDRLLAMLAVDTRTDGFLDAPVEARFGKLATSDLAEGPLPDRIGPYKIVRLLGRGGMAIVYLAEREEDDFHQTVALKVVQPSRLGPQWRDRFLQERQILASMSHPHIAQLLDGGMSAEGGPFFAMEYIDGLPITHHCDQRQLGIRQRLELLIPICEAVSYAHRNLIVHRDLKPSNILVDAHDQPKLLDFGIAKLLSDPDSSLTVTGQRAMTPDYAAPEQFTGAPVTTATDVYALGILLYELLAGKRPFDGAGKSPFELEKQIVQGMPPAFGELSGNTDVRDQARIAAARGISWQRLLRTLSGDLQNVVLQAVRAEPERRYVSAAALADDLRRYLAGQPVRARADSAWYRVSKFVGRHRLGVVLGAGAVVALLTSTGFAIHQAQQANQAAAAAMVEAQRATETRDFLASLFESSRPDQSLGERLTVRQLLDQGARRIDRELASQPAIQAEMTLLMGETYGQLGLFESALPKVERAVDLFQPGSTKQLKARLSLAWLLRQMGNFEAAGDQLTHLSEHQGESTQLLRSRLLIERGELAREQARFDEAKVAFEAALTLDQAAGNAVGVARDFYRLASLNVSTGNNDEALVLMERAIMQLREHGEEVSTLYASIQHDLGVLLIQKGQLDRARVVLEEVDGLRERMLGEAHPDLAATIKELAVIARMQGDDSLAEQLYLKALGINEAMLGSDHPETANNLNSLAVFYRGIGENERALDFARKALAGAQVVYGSAHPTVGVMTTNVGNLLRMVGEFDEAKSQIETGLSIILNTVGPEHQLAGVAENALAGTLYDLGEYQPARRRFESALATFTKAVGSEHPHILQIRTGLARTLAAMGQLSEAAEHYQAAALVGEKSLPAGHINTRIAWLGLAQMRATAGACESALTLFDAHIDAVRESTDPAHQSALAQSVQAVAACRD